ncbi:MAG: MaoC family dehydratase [Candidatus Eremiobacteraeota bacterium]|nr:MaoC family dehydratase [Candidatus Eremiobacteraeota bacterium]
MPERYFEDWTIGERVETRSITVTRESVVAFAHEYDPQPFHFDDAAAARSFFGRIAASGWQTASYAMRLIVESGVFGKDGGIGLGVDALRWLKPVYPGDTLRVTCECTGKRAHPEKPNGVIHFRNVTYNGDDEAVMTHVAIALVAKRAAVGA